MYRVAFMRQNILAIFGNPGNIIVATGTPLTLGSKYGCYVEVQIRNELGEWS